jgi:hypothetical protein
VLRKRDSRGGANGVELTDMSPRSAQHTDGRKGAGVMVRQRSVSSAAATGRPRPSGMQGEVEEAHASGGVRRSNTTNGKGFTEGLKRRFGSLRRKAHHSEE